LNNFAVSSDGIATALKDSASSLVAANNTYEEAVALIASANRVVQDPGSVGAALRTISLRLRGTSTKELEEAGEDTTGVVESKSKLRTKIQGYTGVDILTDTGAYKSTYEILLEISEVWDKLTDQDQAGLLELIAGKTRSNTAAAILSNGEDLKDALLAAQEAEGSALRENEKYLDSIQGKLDQFNNAIQTMWSNTLDDDMVKGVVELGTELVKIVDNFGLIKALVIAIGTFLIQKNFKGDLFGGLFSTRNIEDVRVKLQALKTEYDKAQQAYDANHTGANKRYLDSTKKTYEKYDAKVSPQLKEYDALIAKRQQLSDELVNAQAHEEFQMKRLAAGYDNAAKGVDNARNNITRIRGEITQTEGAIQNVEQQLQQTGIAGATAGQKIKAGFKSAGESIVKFGKQMLSSMAYMYIITTTIELIGTGISWLIKKILNAGDSFENLQEKFEEATNAVDVVKSEIKSLESELETTDERIEELLELGTLTFVEQEELNRLKSVSDELRAQIGLKQQLQGSLQQGANDATIVVADKYMDTSFANENTRTEVEDKGAETGEFVGKLAGIGIAIAALAAAIPTGGASLLAIPVALGAPSIGNAIGSGVAGANYDAEESVGEAIENMNKQRDQLIQARNEALAAYADGSGSEEAYNVAEQELTEYNANLAKAMTQIAEYRNAIMSDTKNATTQQLEQAKAWGDILDAYNVEMGGSNAKSNAIARIFGDEAEGGFAKAKKEIDALKTNLTEAKKSGEAVDDALAALEGFQLNLSEEEVERLRTMGIYLYEVEDYFKNVVETESEFIDNDLEGVAKDIDKITDGLDSLKSAFDEVIEEGNLTAKTVLSLKEALGIGVDDTEELTTAWREYLEVMMSGAATTEEMVGATEKLTQAWLEDARVNDSLKPETKMEFIAQLRSLGVKNAEEYVEDLLQKNMVQDLQSGVVADRDTVAHHYGQVSGGQDLRNEVATWTDAELNDYAKKYGIVDAEVTDAHKKEIMERYGIEEDSIDAVIDKINQQKDLEQQFADKQNDVKVYNEWRNGKNGFEAIAQDVETLQKELGNFDPTKWAYGVRESEGVVIDSWYSDGSQRMTEKQFNTIKEKYEELLTLKQRYDALWREGESKGYIVDGKVVDPHFQTDLDKLQSKINDIDEEIDTERTVNVELELELQKFDDSVDKIQDAYSTLKNITTEYNTQGYLSLDNLQALLNLSPEYLAVLQMEGGQLTINQSALEAMLQTKLADAEATAVQTAITQLNALAERKKAIEVSNSAVAANQASIELGTYSNMLGTVAQDAIVAAGSVTAFNNALRGAQDNTFVSDDEINQILSNFNNSVELINSVRDNLPTSFNNILDPGSKTADEEVDDDRFQKEMDYWENRIGANQAKYEQLQNEIDLLEAKGQKADASFYEEQIQLENERKWLLEQQKAEAQAFLDTLEEGSEEWF
jgi:predicted  nucleic acid-binding Zn-ribbon protein